MENLLTIVKCLFEDQVIYNLSLLLSLTESSPDHNYFSEINLKYAFLLDRIIQSKMEPKKWEKTCAKIFEAIEELEKFEPFLQSFKLFSLCWKEKNRFDFLYQRNMKNITCIFTRDRPSMTSRLWEGGDLCTKSVAKGVKNVQMYVTSLLDSALKLSLLISSAFSMFWHITFPNWHNDSDPISLKV